jgi:hypothetical protein
MAFAVAVIAAETGGRPSLSWEGAEATIEEATLTMPYWNVGTVMRRIRRMSFIMKDMSRLVSARYLTGQSHWISTETLSRLLLLEKGNQKANNILRTIESCHDIALEDFYSWIMPSCTSNVETSFE